MNYTFTNNSIPAIVPMFRFQWEQAQGCYVILYPEGMVKLNPSAGEIIKRCNSIMTVSEIIKDLKRQFPDADLEADVRKFLEVAYDNGWIRFNPSA